jgi:predicted metal-dependent phosphoesterase TrpH
MIDLHTHTDQSDGSVPPEQLLQQAAALGLEALAITDHDTFAGYDIAALQSPPGLDLICGVELSTRLERVKSAKRASSVHLLGYFVNQPPAAEFREWLSGMQASRRKRNIALIAKLQSLGIDITLEEVQALGRHQTGRPHFAKVLLQKGYVASLQEAFDVYLADHAKAAVEREEPSLHEGIEHVAAAGGFPSLAHPVRLEQGRDSEALRVLIRQLIPIGLQGIEAYHSEHSASDTALFCSIADEFHLAVTGGSDYHGDNKPSISLGTGHQGNLSLPYSLLEEMRRARPS